jgi:hypothetical protein
MAAVNYILHFFSEQPPVRLTRPTTSTQTLLLSHKRPFTRQTLEGPGQPDIAADVTPLPPVGGVAKLPGAA